MSMYIVVHGPPGSGKSTQSTPLAQQIGVPYISASKLFRLTASTGSKIGIIFQSRMQQGDLLPDASATKVIIQRLKEQDCFRGFILDGFPSTIGQAKRFDNAINLMGKRLSLFIYLNMLDEVLLQRLHSRWVSRKTGKSFIVSQEHLIEEISRALDPDDNLIQRSDDLDEEIIIHRLQVHRSNIQPVIDFYKDKGVFVNIDANHYTEDVQRSIIEKLPTI